MKAYDERSKLVPSTWRYPDEVSAGAASLWEGAQLRRDGGRPSSGYLRGVQRCFSVATYIFIRVDNDKYCWAWSMLNLDRST